MFACAFTEESLQNISKEVELLGWWYVLVNILYIVN